VADQFQFDPDTYLDVIRREVPAYERLQDRIAGAAAERTAATLLELGVGTGVTGQRVANVHPGAHLVGIDESAGMLEHARRALPDADLRVARLQDPLPDGPYELVFSALAVHHLDGREKADLFLRVAGVLRPGGRFVLGDVIVPDDPNDAVTPIDDGYDKPSTVPDQLAWLADAGFEADMRWVERDLAVLVASLPA
jgi:tRNA (cmo5U34)-methyltransferase